MRNYSSVEEGAVRGPAAGPPGCSRRDAGARSVASRVCGARRRRCKADAAERLAGSGFCRHTPRRRRGGADASHRARPALHCARRKPSGYGSCSRSGYGTLPVSWLELPKNLADRSVHDWLGI